MAVIAIATVRSSRAAVTTRANTSRPYWSVPITCALDGAVFTTDGFGLIGSWRLRQGPAIARKRTSPSAQKPTIAEARVRRTRRHHALPRADDRSPGTTGAEIGGRPPGVSGRLMSPAVVAIWPSFLSRVGYGGRSTC